jgi:hypothetical protein
MQVDIDELVHVIFQGKMVEMLIEIDREMYSPYVVYEHGEMVLYVELEGTVRNTPGCTFVWEKLSKQLKEWGFDANPYDPCVMNKMICGKQITVAWHVDDLKISHVDVGTVDQFIEQLDETVGKEGSLTKSRGKIHNYLGMTLDFSVPGTLKVLMDDYIKMVLADVPPELKARKAATPAVNYLFDVRDVESSRIEESRTKVYHRITMQLLFLSQRARPDLRLVVSSFGRRVTRCNEDDWKKLGRAIRYLEETIDLPLRLQSDGSGNPYWYVDASFGVHPDMKGHIGGTLTMGSGSIYSFSSAQKIVARSSTESGLIGVHDLLPQMLWSVRFLEAQGHRVKATIQYRDNMSSMRLATNGMGSSSRRTRHILLRYYFVKEHVDNGTIEIVHCPTDKMWADYFTKPLQGSQFYKLRDLIMNIDPSSLHHSSHRSVSSKIKHWVKTTTGVAQTD